MKYSPTIRIVNLVVFFVLFAGFAALGIWAGILVAPFIIRQYGPIDLPDMSFGLAWELGALGFAGTIISLGGLIYSVLGMVHGNDDNAVRHSLSCYIGLGLLITIFLFLNGTWLYRLTTTNFGYSELGFAIAFFVVLAVIIGIAVSVPFVKMHGDDVNQNSQMVLISGVSFAVNAGIAIPGILAMIFSRSVGNFNYFIPKLLTVSLVPAAAAILSGFAFLGYHHGEATGAVKKMNGVMFESSLLVDGLGFLAAGCFSYFYADVSSYAKTSFISSTWNKPDVNYIDFSVMSWILGGLLILFVFGIVVSSFRSAKKAGHQA